MTEEEIEAVARELAKVGGASWYPGRTQGPLLRAVSERYRDRARVAIAALERLKASKEGRGEPQGSPTDNLMLTGQSGSEQAEHLQAGAIVVYRPPGERRAMIYQVEQIKEGRAYLVPSPRSDAGWVSLEDLSLAEAGANRPGQADG